jgi:hypothetical protein
MNFERSQGILHQINQQVEYLRLEVKGIASCLNWRLSISILNRPMLKIIC